MGRVVRLALEHRDISPAALAVAANALRDLRDHREWAAAMLMPLCDQLGIRDVLWYPARNTASSRDLGSESRSRAWRCTFALRDGGTPRTKAMATTSFQHAPTSALASESARRTPTAPDCSPDARAGTSPRKHPLLASSGVVGASAETPPSMRFDTIAAEALPAGCPQAAASPAQAASARVRRRARGPP